MFFTFSVVVLFSHLTNAFIFKKFCLLMLLKAFAHFFVVLFCGCFFFNEGIIVMVQEINKIVTKNIAPLLICSESIC